MTNSEYAHRCYYEILGIDMKSSDQEIRKAYKIASLRCHPDRNYGKEQEAQVEFKEIQNAYTVLIDPDERSWYDSHREAILRGYDEGTYAPDELNVMNYFTSACYNSFGDETGGFFAVYKKVFDTIIDEEIQHDSSVKFNAPRFGDSTTEFSSQVREFYQYWKNFITKKTFAWKEEYKLNEIFDRQSRREAERLNNKVRATARREYTQLVQELVGFVFNRDPRVAKEKERKDAEKADKEATKAQKALEQFRRRREINRNLWEEQARKEVEEDRLRAERGETLDGSILDLLYVKQSQMEAALKTGNDINPAGGPFGGVPNFEVEREEKNAKAAVEQSGGGVYTSSPVGPKDQYYYRCIACKKRFGSLKLWNEHISSSKHKSKIKPLLTKGADLSTLLITPEGTVEVLAESLQNQSEKLVGALNKDEKNSNISKDEQKNDAKENEEFADNAVFLKNKKQRKRKNKSALGENDLVNPTEEMNEAEDRKNDKKNGGKNSKKCKGKRKQNQNLEAKQVEDSEGDSDGKVEFKPFTVISKNAFGKLKKKY